MFRVIGKKTHKIHVSELAKLADNLDSTIIDLGTGDGRFIYENAKTKHSMLFIGVDLLAESMREYSAKCEKQKITNAVYLIGSSDSFLPEAKELANTIYINLPWGSLLADCIKPSPEFIHSLGRVLKQQGTVVITLGYSEEFEQKEITRLNLPAINLETIKLSMVPMFTQNGFELNKITELSKEEIANIGSTWAKKLKFGNNRPVFTIVFTRC